MSDKKLNVAVYSGNIPSTTFIENLIEGLSESGFGIYLFGKQTKEVNYKGDVKIFSTPVSDLRLALFVIKESVKLLFKDPRLLLKSLKIIRSRKKKLKIFFTEAGAILPILNNPPDVFHIQWAKTVEQYPELFELVKCKFALSLRGAHINYSPLNDKTLANAYRKNFPLIDGFHAVSKAIGKESLKYGADEKKIHVIHSSVRKDLLEKKAELYQKEKALEIISIGRHHWKKGYDYALDVMKAMKDERMDFKYTLVAQGDVPEEILFLLDEYGLHDHVEIIKGMPYDKLIERLQRSHLLLLPSVEEGIANVVLEAMAVGVPVVTTDCGGMNEVIQDKVNGYIVPVRSPGLLLEKIKEFITADHDLKRSIVSNAKQTISEEFSKEKQISDFRNFYLSL